MRVGMNLKEFVAQTLTQIVEGVAEAQKSIAEGGSGASVNPHMVSSSARRKIGKASPVSFDVALTVSEAADSTLGASASASFLSVVSAKMTTKGEITDRSRNEAVSRVQFSVELAQPSDLTEYYLD